MIVAHVRALAPSSSAAHVVSGSVTTYMSGIAQRSVSDERSTPTIDANTSDCRAVIRLRNGVVHTVMTMLATVKAYTQAAARPRPSGTPMYPRMGPASSAPSSATTTLIAAKRMTTVLNTSPSACRSPRPISYARCRCVLKDSACVTSASIAPPAPTLTSRA